MTPNPATNRRFVACVIAVLGTVITMLGFVQLNSMESQVTRAIGGSDLAGYCTIALGVAGIIAGLTLWFRKTPFPLGPAMLLTFTVLIAVTLHFVAFSRRDPHIHALAFSTWVAAGLGFTIYAVSDDPTA
jgi:hypothetical protein